MGSLCSSWGWLAGRQRVAPRNLEPAQVCYLLPVGRQARPLTSAASVSHLFRVGGADLTEVLGGVRKRSWR